MKTYSEALKSLVKAMEAERDAKNNIKTAQDEFKRTSAAIPEAYEALTDITADQQAGLATERNVEDARIRFIKVQEDAQRAKMSLDVAEKLLPIRKRLTNEARKALKDPAVNHYKEKGLPIAKRMLEAIEELKQASSEAEELQEEAMKYNIYCEDVLPASFELVFNIKGSIRSENCSNYQSKLQSITN
jgi:hypothetical protein